MNSDVHLSNCSFRENEAGELGGAIMMLQASPEVNACTFLNNSANTDGGAIAIYGPLDDPEGQESAPAITNCVFGGNTAVQFGGALLVNDGRPIITNCTVYGNTAATAGGLYALDSRVLMTNNIFWGDQNDEIATETTDLTVRYCNVQGGWLGNGNINANPLLAAPSAGNYHLSSGSPCIDAGRNTASVMYGSVTTDFDGDSRTGAYDIGADEAAGRRPGGRRSRRRGRG